MSKLSFEDMSGTIWMDGQMVDWKQAQIHVLTHALHYGSSVFEGIRVYNGAIFKLTEHMERLLKSAEIMDMKMPYTVAELNQVIQDVLDLNNIKDGYIRPIAWVGSETMGISTKNTAKTHVAVAAWEWPSYFAPEERLKGISLRTSPWRRPAPDCAPTDAKAAGLYMICTLSKHQAESMGYTDAMMLDYRGYVAEATGANIFFVIDGKIHTPTPDCFLNGITRQTVLELAKNRGIEIVERFIMPDEIHAATEVFITGTAAEITPVSKIDDLSFTPSTVTQMLIADYDALVRGTEKIVAAE